MTQNIAADYANFIDINLTKEFSPIEESIDNMLTRLEEFESMVTMVQQESGNIIGITGTLSQVAGHKSYLEKLCLSVDVLDCLVVKIRHTLDSLEDKVQQAEAQYGYLENNTLLSFFKPKIFKKLPEIRSPRIETKAPSLNLNEYFKEPTL